MDSVKIDDKLLKQLEKMKKEERAKKAELRKINYNKLNYPLMCAYCCRMTNFNILYFHHKTKRCQTIKKMMLDKNPELERTTLIKTDKIRKVLLKMDIKQDETIDILYKIANGDINEIHF